MPGFDQTGPGSKRPMTGRGRGTCMRPAGGYGITRFDDAMPMPGRGMAYRHGARGNRGFGRQLATGRPADELDALKTQATALQESLQALNNRITNIENQL